MNWDFDCCDYNSVAHHVYDCDLCHDGRNEKEIESEEIESGSETNTDGGLERELRQQVLQPLEADLDVYEETCFEFSRTPNSTLGSDVKVCVLCQVQECRWVDKVLEAALQMACL